MRWVRIRKADINETERTILEQCGVAVAQQIFAARFNVLAQAYDNRAERIPTALISERALIAWLAEQHDYEERRETWSLTMEAAITIFVLVELVFSIVNFARKS
jgi:cation transport regulator ChaB